MRLNNKNKYIKFESLQECIDLKNYLISFIKMNKREIYDKGNDPELIINIKNIHNGTSNE